MEQKIEEYYKFYQKKSDPIIRKSFYDLEKESDNSEKNNRITAIKRVIEERGLEIKSSIKENKEENVNNEDAFNDYLKSGAKSVVIGLILFGISILLMSQFDNKIFLITIVIGGLKFLQGVIELGVGLYIRVSQADNFK